VLQNDPPTTLRHWQTWVPMLYLIGITTWLVIWTKFPLSQHSPNVALLVYPLLAIGYGGALRVPFLRLTLGPDGVCAHNFVRNQSVAWADLSDVSINSTVNLRFAKRYYWIELETKSGRVVQVRGLTSYTDEVLEEFVSRIVQAAPPGSGAYRAPVPPDPVP
jgi:hypothetical protein